MNWFFVAVEKNLFPSGEWIYAAGGKREETTAETADKHLREGRTEGNVSWGSILRNSEAFLCQNWRYNGREISVDASVVDGRSSLSSHSSPSVPIRISRLCCRLVYPGNLAPVPTKWAPNTNVGNRAHSQLTWNHRALLCRKPLSQIPRSVGFCSLGHLFPSTLTFEGFCDVTDESFQTFKAINVTRILKKFGRSLQPQFRSLYFLICELNEHHEHLNDSIHVISMVLMFNESSS